MNLPSCLRHKALSDAVLSNKHGRFSIWYHEGQCYHHHQHLRYPLAAYAWVDLGKHGAMGQHQKPKQRVLLSVLSKEQGRGPTHFNVLHDSSPVQDICRTVSEVRRLPCHIKVVAFFIDGTAFVFFG